MQKYPVLLRPSLLILTFGSLFALHCLLHAGVFIDDSYITFRYAANLVKGLGLVFNPGEHVEGYTNFLWVIISAAMMEMGGDVEVFVPFIGFGAGLAVLVYGYYAARAMAKTPTPLSGVLYMVMVASATGLAFYSVTGLETSLFTLFITVGALSVARLRSISFVIFTSLAFYTRPEAGLLGVLGLIWFASNGVKAPTLLRMVLGFIVLITPYLGFKVYYFGSIVPNTLAAKYPSLSEGMDYVAKNYAGLGALVACAAWLLLRRRVGRGLWFLGLYFTAATISVIGTGGDWMPLDRFLVPYLPVFAILIDSLLTSDDRFPIGAHGVVCGAFAALSLAGYLYFQLDRSMALHRAYSIKPKADHITRLLGQHIKSQGYDLIALFDVGLIGYIAADTKILDIAGLADPVVAHSPGGHGDKAIPIEYLKNRSPELFIMTSSTTPVDTNAGTLTTEPLFQTWNKIMENPWFNHEYRLVYIVMHSEHFWWHIYAKRALKVTPPAFILPSWDFTSG